MPLTKSQMDKYKKAFQPENIKKGLAGDALYLHKLYTNLIREGKYQGGELLIDIVPIKGKENNARYNAIDLFINSSDASGLASSLKQDNLEQVIANQMSMEDIERNYEEIKQGRMPVSSKEPSMGESKKLSGRRVKGKTIEKGGRVVRKMDFGKPPGSKEKEPMMTTPPESEVEEDTPNLRGATKRMKAFEEPREGEKVTPPMTSPEGVTAPTYPVKTTNKGPEQRVEQKSNLRGGMREAKAKRKEAEARLEATLESIPGDIPPAEEVIPPMEGERKNVEMDISNSGRGVENSVSKVEGGGGPTIYDTIPKEKLITEGKSVKQLKMDILYFFKRFSKELKNVKVDRKNNNLAYLQAKHKEIVAKLKAGQTEKPTEKIGVIISAPDFIKQKLKEIILENTINGLTIQDMIINIEGKEAQQSSDTGKYEFKEGPDGKPRAKEEPIYRHIPEVNTSQSQRMKARIPNTATKYRGLEQTAKQEVRQNPFSKPQKTIRLKYSY